MQIVLIINNNIINNNNIIKESCQLIFAKHLKTNPWAVGKYENRNIWFSGPRNVSRVRRHDIILLTGVVLTAEAPPPVLRHHCTGLSLRRPRPLCCVITALGYIINRKLHERELYSWLYLCLYFLIINLTCSRNLKYIDLNMFELMNF